MSSTVLRAPLSSDTPQILLFPGARDPDDGDDQLSVRAAYEKFLLPDQQLNSKGNRTKYNSAIRLWEIFAGDGSKGSGPTIGEACEGNHLRNFRDAMIAREYSPVHIRVICRYVRNVFRAVGPPDSRNPEGRDIVPRIPFARPPRAPRKRVEIVPFALLGPWYEACRMATWPDNQSIPAPLWWRTLLTIGFTYGLRRGDLIATNCKRDGLAWSSLHLSADSPDPEVPLSNGPGWLFLTPRKTRRTKGELLLPLTRVVRAHLDAIVHRGGLVLPSKARYRTFRDQNILIQKAAGLRIPIDQKGREKPFTIQMLRRSCKTYWSSISPEIARYIGGWSARGVDESFYLNPVATLLQPDAKGERLFDRFRYPDAFLAGPG